MRGGVQHRLPIPIGLFDRRSQWEHSPSSAFAATGPAIVADSEADRLMQGCRPRRRRRGGEVSASATEGAAVPARPTTLRLRQVFGAQFLPIDVFGVTEADRERRPRSQLVADVLRQVRHAVGDVRTA
jgi:hypothetical protein